MKRNFLILATHAPNKHLINAIVQRGHTYEWLDPSYFYLKVATGMKYKGEAYDGRDKKSPPKLIEWHKYDAVIPRIGKNREYNLNVLAFLTEICGLYSPQTAAGIDRASNKWLTHQILAAKGLSTITSIFANEPAHPADLIKLTSPTMPIILKKIYGSQGKQVIKCNDFSQTVDTITTFWNSEEQLLLQKYIDSRGKDFRVIVVGNSVASVMEREAIDGWKANLSIGGGGKEGKITNAEAELCVKASRALGLEFSGVDLIRDSDGNSYITEVNSNMGSKIIDITERNHFIDLIIHIERDLYLNTLPSGHPDRLRQENQQNGGFGAFGSGKNFMAMAKNKLII